MSSNGFAYSEAKLSEQRGISRTDIKAIRERQLKEGVDWKKVGGEVALAASGVKRLWKELGCRKLPFDLTSCLLAPVKKNGAAAVTPIRLGTAAMPIPVEMVVTQICLNTALVRAQQTSGLDRRTQIVWVGRNFNYSAGMRILVAPKKNMPSIWIMAGPEPRRRLPAQQWNRLQQTPTQHP